MLNEMNKDGIYLAQPTGFPSTEHSTPDGMSRWNGQEAPRKRPYKPRAKRPARAARELMTVGDLAKMLRVTEDAIYHMVARYQVPYLKMGRLVRFDPDQIEGWLKGKRVTIIEDPC